MQRSIHSERETWSTRGFSTVDPERQGVRTADLLRRKPAAPAVAGRAPVAATGGTSPIQTRKAPAPKRR